jgi:hypothetical protein
MLNNNEALFSSINWRTQNCLKLEITLIEEEYEDSGLVGVVKKEGRKTLRVC